MISVIAHRPEQFRAELRGATAKLIRLIRARDLAKTN
jgi:hypothetical protein